MTDGSARSDGNHTRPDRRSARVGIHPCERERAAALLRDHARAVDGARVGRGIGAVEDESAVVRERRHSEYAGRAANTNLERAAEIQIDRVIGALRERTPHRHEAAAHGERAGAGVADNQIAAIGPRAARHRGRAVATGVVAEIAVCVGDAAPGHVQRAGAVVADAEVVVNGPRAAAHLGRADAAGQVAENAVEAGNAAAGHVQHASALVANVEAVASGPRAAAHRGRAAAADQVAEIAVCAGDAAAAYVQRAGALVADGEVAAIGPRAAAHRGRAVAAGVVAEIAVLVGDAAAGHVQHARVAD